MRKKRNFPGGSAKIAETKMPEILDPTSKTDISVRLFTGPAKLAAPYADGSQPE